MHCCMYRQEEEESERDTEGEETHCIVHLESFLIASKKEKKWRRTLPTRPRACLFINMKGADENNFKMLLFPETALQLYYLPKG